MIMRDGGAAGMPAVVVAGGAGAGAVGVLMGHSGAAAPAASAAGTAA